MNLKLTQNQLIALTVTTAVAAVGTFAIVAYKAVRKRGV